MSVIVQRVGGKKLEVRSLKLPTPNLQPQTVLFTKGAPESILEICDSVLIGQKQEKLTPAKIKIIEEIMEKWAKKGLRVLAFAYKSSEKFGKDQLTSANIRHRKNSDRSENSDISGLSDLSGLPMKADESRSILNSSETDMIFLGMVAIHDPPRPEVLAALAKTKQAGIKTVMITGDNEITAEAIGVSTGFIKEGDEILTGKQLDEYSDAELLQKLARVKVFARTTPFHKSRIVRLYQESGEIVAVTGD